MAKKEEKKTSSKPKATAGKKAKATDKKPAPEKSGEVKGPMGVGGVKIPDSKATEKKPSKVTGAVTKKAKKTTSNKQNKQQQQDAQRPDQPFDKLRVTKEQQQQTSAGQSSNNSKTKTLPEKTKDIEEHLTIKSSEKGSSKESRAKKISPMHEKDNTPIILGTSAGAAPKTKTSKKTSAPKKKAPAKKVSFNKPLTEKVDAETVKENIKSRRKEAAEDREKSAPTKKMARRKAEKGISAEEKAKLPDTSVTEDLKSAAKKSVQKLADSLIPDQETQEQLKELAQNLLPDEKDMASAAEKLKDKIPTDAASLVQRADELLPKKEPKKKSGISPEGYGEGPEKQKTEEVESTSSTGSSVLSEYDIHLFKEGKHFHLYRKLGAKVTEHLGIPGVHFAVWAPNASKVSVIGDFNFWDRDRHPMENRWDQSGIWEIFIPEAQKGSLYKYFVESNNGYQAEKGDPFALMWETPPKTASVVWDLKFSWNDHQWREKKKSEAGRERPLSIYELHLGSWKRVPEEDVRPLTYRELAEQLPPYLNEMGFTDVEFMPVMEHPFFGSWGYQITGYFAPSSRYGTPQDFMHLIDSLHTGGIGVILDWVPSHFPDDQHGLHFFDGTFLYEHQNKNKGFHPDWQSYIFNYGRQEVRSFLISNAVYWLDLFHADGLRVDAVASMLYLDYSRKEGEWEPNQFGGRENLEAISFLKELNEVLYREFPDTLTIAEESTAWPMVSRPTYLGGLGFGMKWMMGWMHDSLEYFKKDPIHRKHYQNTITFSLNYAFNENFVLPFSHDEVVYGKQPLIYKMPGNEEQRFANLRCLYAYMFAHPGAKLLFMGSEFAQTSEWHHDTSLDWHLLQYDKHQGMQELVKGLNKLYTSEPALYENSFNQEGFEWVEMDDTEHSVISFLRKGHSGEKILVVCNFTPITRENYSLQLSDEDSWGEIFNSDEGKFGGSNVRNVGWIQAAPQEDGRFKLEVTLPPLGVVFLKKIPV